MNCNYNKKTLKNVNLKNALPFYTPDFDLDENNLRELNLQIDCAVKSILNDWQSNQTYSQLKTIYQHLDVYLGTFTYLFEVNDKTDLIHKPKEFGDFAYDKLFEIMSESPIYFLPFGIVAVHNFVRPDLAGVSFPLVIITRKCVSHSEIGEIYTKLKNALDEKAAIFNR